MQPNNSQAIECSVLLPTQLCGKVVFIIYFIIKVIKNYDHTQILFRDLELACLRANRPSNNWFRGERNLQTVVPLNI